MSGPSLSVEGLNKTKDWPPWARGNSASTQLSDLNCNISFSLGLQPANSPCRFWTCQPSIITWASSLSKSPWCVYKYIYIYLSNWFHFSEATWQMQEASRYIHSVRTAVCYAGNPLPLTTAKALLLNQGRHLCWIVLLSIWHHCHSFQRSPMHYIRVTRKYISRL